MDNLPLLVPLVILAPSLGAIINFFVGARLGEKWSGYIGCFASIFAFIISLLLLTYVTGTDGSAAVVNPPLVDGWLRIESIGLEIPWQLRVDSLSVTMMLVVTGVGSLIHLYARGYMHGDKLYPRFFAYLNMFLAFMLILVTANNFLMLFVGWEGVGLCSFLLIGFWWDKKMPEGWKNSNAARKAFIVNRIGDFGLLMAMFLIFWTFGTLDFYKAGELPNTEAKYLMGWREHNGLVDHVEEGDQASTGDESAAGDKQTDDGHGGSYVCKPAVPAADDGSHDIESQHGAPNPLANDIRAIYCDNHHFDTDYLGVFGQTGERFGEGEIVDFNGFEMAFDDVVFLIALFMLLGVAGKSAQIPLFVWLPDAMAGPTPVSALIHAATMVTAGVYMMVRANVLLWELNHGGYVIGLIITLVGSGTALMAGYIALGQWDIKRVLAYSTISQLGFMVAAVGIGAYVAAMFHLVTHAVFKALLFLGSGSVIHGVEHGHHHAHGHGHGHDDDHDDHHDQEFDAQDMRNMGGLRKRMPITYITYLIGTLALAGIFPFAGFWSKDEILADAWYEGFQLNELGGFIAFGILLVAAAFTAFYMWRQIVLVFFDDARSEAARQAPESNGAMLLPLVVLAIFTCIIGLINVPKATPIFANIYETYEFKHFLEHSLLSVSRGHSLDFNLLIAGIALALGIASIVVAHNVYKGKGLGPGNSDQLERHASSRAAFRLANARLYWDEIYGKVIEQPFNRLATFLADRVDWDFLHNYFHDSIIKRGFDSIAKLLGQPIDLGIIDGTVNGVALLVQRLANWMRGMQTGYVRLYAVVIFIGVVAVILLMLLPFIQTMLQSGS
ncbi:MAG: proton-conducting transporter membrane subunit [Chloroflexi bacterium]|nr:proton-conducting transporter membrane subunit [Chloroflexota bacterium]